MKHFTPSRTMAIMWEDGMHPDQVLTQRRAQNLHWHLLMLSITSFFNYFLTKYQNYSSIFIWFPHCAEYINIVHTCQQFIKIFQRCAKTIQQSIFIIYFNKAFMISRKMHWTQHLTEADRQCLKHFKTEVVFWKTGEFNQYI